MYSMILALGMGSAASAPLNCVREVDLSLMEIDRKITIEIPGHVRKDTIRVHLAVDCSGGRPRRPATEEEAIGMLDAALPADYKRLWSQIPCADYQPSPYLGSVTKDVENFLDRAWGLEGGSPLCPVRPGDEGLSCFEMLMTRLSRVYYTPPQSPATGAPARPDGDKES